jgi:fatty acyl-CoA reductase
VTGKRRLVVANDICSQIFQRIRDEKPEVFQKVIPLQGDLSLENLGLNEKHYELLINEVNLVYHFAATLRLEATLRNAVEMNLVSYRSS